MNIPELPPPDEKGRIVLHPPGHSRSLMVQYPLGLGLVLGEFLWIWLSKRNEATPLIFVAFALPFLVWSGYLAFAPYQVILDDTGISAGLKPLLARILWNQIEKIRLPDKHSRGVLVSRTLPWARGRSVGVYVVALAPLSAEETAGLILGQAQKYNAPVKQIDSGKDTTNDDPPSIFAIGLVMVVITFFLWKVGIIGGRH